MAAVLVATFAFLGALAAPAAADPAVPTDHRSTVDAVEPHPEGFAVEVIGGDSFLEVRADPGRTITVFAYDGSAPDGRGEPFLRIRADGTVEENRQSPYTFLIGDRFGTTPPPADLDPAGPPEWVRVAGGGRWAWHDHRIHWMSPVPKAGVAPGEAVLTWEVPFEVDGTAVLVTGTLRRVAPVAVPVVALVAVVAFVVVGAAGRGSSARAAAVAMVAVALAATVVGVGEVWSLPAEARPGVLAAVLPVFGLVVAVVAVVMGSRRQAPVAALASVATLLGWVLLRRMVLVRPVLPTELPAWFDRSVTAAVAGATLAAAVLVVRSGALAPVLPEAADGGPAGGDRRDASGAGEQGPTHRG